jgi:NAD(P)-dependent dehydrogenase (short-subunit alcohol dehydrogenase family)
LDTLNSELFNQILPANIGSLYLFRYPLTEAAITVSGVVVVINISSAAAITGAGSNIADVAAKEAINTMTISILRPI